MSKTINRRDFIKTSGALLAGGTLLPLVGCSPSASDPEPPPPDPQPPQPQYVNSAIEITDVFTGQGTPSGHITFPNEKTIPIRDGLAEVTASEQLLAGDYRVLIQPEHEGDFVTQSPTISLSDEQVISQKVLPWNFEQFSYERMKDKFMYGNDFNRTTQRWRDDIEILVYHYDQSYYDNELGRFVESSDPQLLAAPTFINWGLAVYERIVDMIPSEANISIDSYIQSQGEITFTTRMDIYAEDVIWNFGEPNARFPITQGSRAGPYGGIRNARLSQDTSFVKSAEFNDDGGLRSDSIENFGIRTSGQDKLLIDQETFDFTAEVPLLITAMYSFAPGSGLVALDAPLPAKDGRTLDVIEHYVPSSDDGEG